MTNNTQLFRSMEGKAYRLGALELVFKRNEDQPEGSYSMFESLEPPGKGVELHRHPAWQETFIVLEGQFEFVVSGERRVLGPRDLIVIPRGAVHGFSCTSTAPGRMLTLSSPARVFEAFVADIAEANKTGSSSDALAVFARHGLELL
jgi:quercetin dioxygenase-like cupin family protein